MISGFIVKKASMTRMYDPDGKLLTCTLCQADPVVVTQLKSQEKDNYEAVQVAYGHKKTLHKPQVGHLKKAGISDTSPRGFVEFDLVDPVNLPKLNDTISFDSVFQEGDSIDATGTSKGRGFSGVLKRHGFHRQPVTRGQSDRTRHTGSIGAQTPGKVVKGKRMPGHFGNATTTVKNLKILKIDKDKNLIYISGSLPSYYNSWIVLKKA